MQSNRELIVEPIGLDVETLARPLDFAALFGNDHPVEMEIGMGKGTFITQQATLHPEINYFGIEYARWFWRYSSDRLRRNKCMNSRAVRAEAMYFVREFVPDASLSVLHIYHPDPWPKKRHHKRRLLQSPFLEQAQRILIPGGLLRIVTDHKEYFEQVDALIKASPLQVVDYTPPAWAKEGELIGTNFERKYIQEGRERYAIAAVKTKP
jgi:tRNA (guanine-N7-)-methyltransferase